MGFLNITGEVMPCAFAVVVAVLFVVVVLWFVVVVLVDPDR